MRRAFFYFFLGTLVIKALFVPGFYYDFCSGILVPFSFFCFIDHYLLIMTAMYK